MKRALVSLFFLFGSTGSWAGGGLDLSLSNEAASLTLLLNPRGLLSAGGTSEMTLGGLVNEQGDYIYQGTLLARGVRRSQGGQYNLGAGMRLVGGELDLGETVSALALGFQASILLGPSKYNPVDLIVEGFFAPAISSFNDADEYSQIGARLQVDVVPQARAYIGYRRVAFDTEEYNNINVDKSMHAGLSIRF